VKKEKISTTTTEKITITLGENPLAEGEDEREEGLNL